MRVEPVARKVPSPPSTRPAVNHKRRLVSFILRLLNKLESRIPKSETNPKSEKCLSLRARTILSVSVTGRGRETTSNFGGLYQGNGDFSNRDWWNWANRL